METRENNFSRANGVCTSGSYDKNITIIDNSRDNSHTNGKVRIEALEEKARCVISGARAVVASKIPARIEGRVAPAS